MTGRRTGARRAGACRACSVRARRLQGGAGAEAGEAREGSGAGRAAAAGAAAAGALAVVAGVRRRNAHLRPKAAWGLPHVGTSWMARCAVPGQGCPSRHQALADSMVGGNAAPSKIEQNACQLFADASRVSRGCNSSLELSPCSPSSPPRCSRSRARSPAARPNYARRGPFCSSRRPSSIRRSSSSPPCRPPRRPSWPKFHHRSRRLNSRPPPSRSSASAASSRRSARSTAS